MLPGASAWRVTRGTRTGQALGRLSLPCPRRYGNRVGRHKKGRRATRKPAASLTASLGGLVSELILNAKREMGAALRIGWRGGGRAQILSGLLAVIGAVQSRCFKAFGGMILHSGPWRTHTKWACIIQVASHAARQSVCNVGPSFPKSPLLRIINKQGGSLYSHFTAGEIHSHNRKSCACCRKILRGGMNVIDLNSSAPASTCRTFGQSDAGERQMKRICNYFFLSVL